MSITDEPDQTKSTITQIAQIDGKDGNKPPKRHKLIPKAFAPLLPFVGLFCVTCEICGLG